MIDKNELEELLNIKKNSLSVSKSLIRAIGLDEAIVYSYLLDKYYSQNKYEGSNNYFLCTVEDIENELSYTAFKQRNLLQSLNKRGLIDIKYGQARTRYILINEDIGKLKEIMYKSSLQSYEEQMAILYEQNKEILEYYKLLFDASKSKRAEIFENGTNYGWVAKVMDGSKGQPHSFNNITQKELIKR